MSALWKCPNYRFWCPGNNLRKVQENEMFSFFEFLHRRNFSNVHSTKLYFEGKNRFACNKCVRLKEVSTL